MDREPVLRKINEAMLLIVKKCIRYKPKEISPSFIKTGFEKILAMKLFIDTLANNKNAAMGYVALIENGIRIGGRANAAIDKARIRKVILTNKGRLRCLLIIKPSAAPSINSK